MASQIVRIESDISDRNFRLVRMHSAVRLRESVALKHVKESGLPRVIKTKEDYIGRLLEEAKPLEGRLEEIVNEHFK